MEKREEVMTHSRIKRNRGGHLAIMTRERIDDCEKDNDSRRVSYTEEALILIIIIILSSGGST